MLAAAVWPWRSATTQCSTRMALAGMRVGPARDVAGGVDAGRARLQKGIDDHAAVDREARLLGQRQARPHADADDDEIGVERARRP